MERDARDCEYSEDLCRLYKEIERTKLNHLDLCDMILNGPASGTTAREWIPAAEWTSKFDPR